MSSKLPRKHLEAIYTISQVLPSNDKNDKNDKNDNDNDSDSDSSRSSRDSDSSHSSREVTRRGKGEIATLHMLEVNRGTMKGEKKVPLFQQRFIVTILVYLGPLTWGLTCHQCYTHPRTQPERSWTLNLLLLGGLSTSTVLFLLVHLLPRPRLLAASSALHCLATVGLMLAGTGKVPGWVDRTAAIACGMAVGIGLPGQQLLTSETGLPAQRSVLSVLNHFLFWFGVTVGHVVKTVKDGDDEGSATMTVCLNIVNVTAMIAHMAATTFFHPDTPRRLFSLGRKSDCLKSLQWLRGRDADIGLEYLDLADSDAQQDSVMTAILLPEVQQEIMARSRRRRKWFVFDTRWIKALKKRSVWQSFLTSSAVLALSSLSGFLPVSLLLVTDFDLDNNNDENNNNNNNNLTHVFISLSLSSPILTMLLINKLGRKTILLISAASLTMTALFLSLLFHFIDDDEDVDLFQERGYGWTILVGATLFLAAHQAGTGPVSWLLSLELVPVRCLEQCLTISCSLWWSLQLVLSLNVERLWSAVGGTSGICWISVAVNVLLYGFVLELVPDVRSGASLEEIGREYERCVDRVGFRVGKKEEEKKERKRNCYYDKDYGREGKRF